MGDLKENEPIHSSMAEDVANRLINDFDSEQQAQFLNSVQDQIMGSYKSKIAECGENLESIRRDYEHFKDNCY